MPSRAAAAGCAVLPEVARTTRMSELADPVDHLQGQACGAPAPRDETPRTSGGVRVEGGYRATIGFATVASLGR